MISQQHCDVFFSPAVALTNVPFTELYNWSCCLERFRMGKLYLDWNFIDQLDNNNSSTTPTQYTYLPFACEGLDGLFLSIYSYQWW